MTENYEKDFVPKNPALALKKLGFDEPCLMAYLGKEKEPYLECDDVRHLQAKDVLNPLKTPTFSQAFRWFREKYNIDAWVQPFTLQKSNGDLYLPDKTYSYFIFKYGVWVGDGVDFLEPEEAELECLNKLIEIVKLKQ
jgi:hypothetical protein